LSVKAGDYFAKIYANFDKQKLPEFNGSSLSNSDGAREFGRI
jgi:hypothetical protein